MKEQDFIFLVAVYCLNEDGTKQHETTNIKGEKYRINSRTWGWFHDFETAEKQILENITDLFEYQYNFAVIEKVNSGMLANTKVCHWYKAIYNKEKINCGPYPEVIKCEPPPYAKNCCNFTIG